ncbi:MAG: hypothetical protein C4297_01760 [Gemmataceae bacterium]
MRKLVAVALIGLGLWLALDRSTVYACPGCAEAVGGEDKGAPVSRLGQAYSASVLFMLAVPALILTGFGLGAYLAVLRHRTAQQSSGSPSPLADSNTSSMCVPDTEKDNTQATESSSGLEPNLH